MRSSTVVFVALAATVPAFGASISAPATQIVPQAGSGAISVSEIDEGVNLVNDAFNAIRSGTQAFQDVFGRSTKPVKGFKKLPKVPTRSRPHARQDGSEAISVSEIEDGVQLVNDAFQAIQSGADAYHDIFGRQDGSEAISVSEIDEGVHLANDAFQAIQSGVNAYHDVFGRQDGSEAISVSEIDEGVQLVSDAFQAIQSGAGAYHDIFGRQDVSEAISVSEIEDGVQFANDAFEEIQSGADAYHDIFGRSTRSSGRSSSRLTPAQRLILLSKLHRPAVARQVSESEALSFGDLKDGVTILKDGYNAVQSGIGAYNSIFGRDLAKALLARHVMDM
ncbi:hypothetical protein CERSUDRAFT_113439 [Gelatoporia subvermispora B]|uniref:Secreted protein n=1 Tax=Ceriporiopsis subvermispora (strain B) TaxID=914234 RepID=M2PP71_CERS8|nr:hypothetical protein CERSUDRAFT_113439 [Gelatoporia subvermispora B]